MPIDDVQNDLIRGRLEGLQQLALTTGQKVIDAEKSLSVHVGRHQAYRLAAQRLNGEASAIANRVGADGVPVDEKERGKLEIKTLQHAATILAGMEQQERDDLRRLEGRISGLRETIDAAEGAFNDEVAKAERWARIEAEEREERRPDNGA